MAYSTVELLPSHVIDHIAAGEVIERPGSVVKELLENSIDAGSKAIQVDIEGGGLSRITISDDGKGMSPEDVRKCYFRHATSKLRNSEELFTVATLGFRGEALSSVASVSRLTITTRRKGEEEGFRIVLEGGKLIEEGPAGCPVGTTMNVENLFFNTPARKKFLRSPATEQAHIVDGCLRVALGAPGVGLVLTSGKRRLLDIPEGVEESLRIQAALGKRVTSLYPFDSQLEGVRVRGFVTKPEIDRGDTKGLWFFINGRYVRDRMLQRAVLDGYQAYLQRGRYPIVIMEVEVSHTVVDVNVHPQKLEVRFSEGGPIFRAVSRAIATVLTESPWSSSSTSARKVQAQVATEAFFNRQTNAPPHTPVPQRAPSNFWGRETRSAAPTFAGRSSTVSESHTKVATPSFATPQPAEPPRVTAEKSFLVVGKRFHLSESANGLQLIDLQEAAAKWSAAGYLNALGAGDVPKHALLFPEVLELDSAQVEFCTQHWEAFPKLGFEIEPVGPKRYALRAIPLAFVGAQPKTLAAGFIRCLQANAFEGNAIAPQLQNQLTQECSTAAIFPIEEGIDAEVLAGLLTWVEEQAQNEQQGIIKIVPQTQLASWLS